MAIVFPSVWKKLIPIVDKFDGYEETTPHNLIHFNLI